MDARPLRLFSSGTTAVYGARGEEDGALLGSGRDSLRRQTVRYSASDGPLFDCRRYAVRHRTARPSTADGTFFGSGQPALHRPTVSSSAADETLFDNRRLDCRSATSNGDNSPFTMTGKSSPSPM